MAWDIRHVAADCQLPGLDVLCMYQPVRHERAT